MDGFPFHSSVHCWAADYILGRKLFLRLTVHLGFRGGPEVLTVGSQAAHWSTGAWAADSRWSWALADGPGPWLTAQGAWASTGASEVMWTAYRPPRGPRGSCHRCRTTGATDRSPEAAWAACRSPGHLYPTTGCQSGGLKSLAGFCSHWLMHQIWVGAAILALGPGARAAVGRAVPVLGRPGGWAGAAAWRPDTWTLGACVWGGHGSRPGPTRMGRRFLALCFQCFDFPGLEVFGTLGE